VEPGVVEFGGLGVESAVVGEFEGKVRAADGAEFGLWDAGLFGGAEGAFGVFGPDADEV
jgi:hypothetical protein